jgi:hypothetical protein
MRVSPVSLLLSLSYVFLVFAHAQCHPGDTCTVTMTDGNIYFRVKDGAEELAFAGIPEGVYYPAVCFYSSSPTIRLLSCTSLGVPAAAAGLTSSTNSAAAVSVNALPRLPTLPAAEDPEAIRAR